MQQSTFTKKCGFSGAYWWHSNGMIPSAAHQHWSHSSYRAQTQKWHSIFSAPIFKQYRTNIGGIPSSAHQYSNNSAPILVAFNPQCTNIQTISHQYWWHSINSAPVLVAFNPQCTNIQTTLHQYWWHSIHSAPILVANSNTEVAFQVWRPTPL